MKQDKKKLYESIMNSVAKQVKKALNESRSDDGWDENELYDLIEVLEDIYNLQYEVKNCVRGAYTNATTYAELADHIEDLASRLEEQAGYIRQIPEPEPDDENEDDSWEGPYETEEERAQRDSEESY